MKLPSDSSRTVEYFRKSPCILVCVFDKSLNLLVTLLCVFEGSVPKYQFLRGSFSEISNSPNRITGFEGGGRTDGRTDALKASGLSTYSTYENKEGREEGGGRREEVGRRRGEEGAWLLKTIDSSRTV